MIAGVGRRLVATAAPATRPGPATAAAIDPSVVVEAPGEVRAAGSFVAVLLFGGVLLYRYGGFVDRSVDASMERPRVAVVYGLMAFALVAFIGGYALTQLARFGAGGPVLAGVAAAGLAALVLAALGFLVVGTLLTDMEGRRRPRYGLVLGAGLSAVGWLLLPPVGGAVVWVLLAAFGVGGATRRWFHTPRRVDRATED
jgi:hypothetical protein